MNKLLSPDVFLYLVFTFFNALLYTLIKFFSVKTGMKTLEIAAYMNVGVFIAYNIVFVRYIWREKLFLHVFKPVNLILSAAMLAAVAKMYCIQYIEPRDAVVITHATPFLVMLFASLFLREKMFLKHWLFAGLSFIGACIYVWEKIEINNIYYVILFLHMAFKATVHIGTRNLAKKSVFQVMFYENFFYSLFAIGYFSHTGNFTVKAFTQWEILVVIIITTISLFGMVKSYSLAKNGISRLQNLDFSKVIFAFIFGILLLSDKVDAHEIAGVSIILFSIILSQVNFSKLSSKALGRKTKVMV